MQPLGVDAEMMNDNERHLPCLPRGSRVMVPSHESSRNVLRMKMPEMPSMKCWKCAYASNRDSASGGRPASLLQSFIVVRLHCRRVKWHRQNREGIVSA